MRTFCPPSSSLCSEVTVLTGLQEPVITPESDHSVIIIIVIITFSRLLSLFRVLTTRVSCQLSLILLQLLLTITPVWSGGPGQGAGISVLCQFYCSHRNERSPVLTAWPALSPQTHMGEPVTADFLWSELCQGRGQPTNRLLDMRYSHHIIDD